MRRAPEPELRIDPEDGMPRTLEELRALCRGRFTEQEILDYWEYSCVAHSGEGIHNVANDPFLTHPSRVSQPVRGTQAPGRTRTPPPAQQQPAVTQYPATQYPPAGQMGTASQRMGTPPPRTPQGAGTMSGSPGGPPGAQTVLPPPSGPAVTRAPDGQPMVDVRADPFMTSTRGRDTDIADVKEDPFLTHDHRTSAEARETYNPEERRSRRQQISQAIATAKRTWQESLVRVLGPGAKDREPHALYALILGPWLVFVWVLLLWVLLRHFSLVATVLLTILVSAFAVSLVILWRFRNRRSGPVSLLALGGLCLIAVGAGIALGAYGWQRHWRQWWWTETQYRDSQTSAETPARARAEFGVLNFWDAARARTVNQTYVDNQRAAGYKDTEYYCVAPVLSTDPAGASFPRVNFWAVGINCCQNYGSFTCDESRESQAGTGVVMLNGGLPCPTCNNDKFRLAVRKAEAVHGLVSVDDALFVRWVKDAGSVERWQFLHALGYVVFTALLTLLLFMLAGWLIWYYGLGIQHPRVYGAAPGAAGGAPKSYGSMANEYAAAAALAARNVNLDASPATATARRT